MPIQCKIPKDRPTIDPANCRVGNTEKAVCATTGKNINPPSQTISESNTRNRRKDMTANYYDRRKERNPAPKTENRELTTKN